MDTKHNTETQPRDKKGQFAERRGHRPISVAKAEGRHTLHRNSTMIANSILSAIRAAKAKNDYQTWGSLSIQAAQYIMPKLQAVAHISPNQAIETMEGLREFLIARDTKQLPPASDTAIEGEFKEVAPAPIESPSVNTGGQHSDVVEPFNGNSAPSPEPSKPFAELSRDEVIARYHPRA